MTTTNFKIATWAALAALTLGNATNANASVEAGATQSDSIVGNTSIMAADALNSPDCRSIQ